MEGGSVGHPSRPLYRRLWLKACTWFKDWPIVFIPTMYTLGLLARIWYMKEYRYRELHRLYTKHQPLPLFIKDKKDVSDIGWCDCGVPMETTGGDWYETCGESWHKQTVFLGLCVTGRGILMLAKATGNEHA